ncbi:hypothetical protein OIU78_017464 [Salix suchowensis]|nr:hypothetical protein OIU78_017464 [Salix suchowensis]
MSASVLVQYNLKPHKRNQKPLAFFSEESPLVQDRCQTSKEGIFPNFFSLFQSHRSLHAATVTDYLQVTSDDLESERKGIDFNALFKSCTKLQQVKCAHTLVVVSGRFKDNFLSSKIVNLYSQHGDVSLAWWTFHHLPNKDVYTWNSMAFAYVSHGRFREALGCFNQFFTTSGLRPDFYTFPPVVKACRDLLDGKKIHCLVLKLGFERDVFVAASLVHMYSRFGLVGDAKKLFDDLPARDRGSWNAMISGYCQNGNAAEALDVADEMRLEGVKMDAITVASVLPVCAQVGDILSGKLIHLYVIKHGLEFELFVSNALINMYAKFGSLGQAQKVFGQMVVRDIVSWNSIIAAYEQNNNPVTARLFFHKMQQARVQPDLLTLVSLASIVAQLNDNRNGRSIHGFVMRKEHKEITPNQGTWVDVFYTGNQTHPRWVEIYRELRGLTAKIKTIGYAPDFSYVLQDVEEDEKEHILMGHSERLAIAYGIISTSPKNSYPDLQEHEGLR